MSCFGYRRELSKYEDVDEDELLASLSPEELAELEKELADIDPDANVPIGLRQRDQTDKTPTGTFSREALSKYWENETRRLLEDEIGGGRKDETSSILKELKNALKPVSVERREGEGSRPSTPMRSAHDQLMESIRSCSLRNLKRVS
uniref:WH2 domain-containing protein n=1 Tax=Labrus bergylta TaxID=56723 RepID=A0A3Q3E477_9LABR